VCGGSGGIGLEVVCGLAATSAILATNPDASLEVVELDLTDLASVHRFAETLRSRRLRDELPRPLRPHRPAPTGNPRLVQGPRGHGARPVLYAATSPDVHRGDFIGPSGLFGVWGEPARVRSSALSHDQHLARSLWQASETMTGVHYAFTGGQPDRRGRPS
jgi:hypothetical protein